MTGGADYRCGDVQTILGPMRLTVGALAELAERLDAPSPSDLAERMRTLTPQASRILQRALLRPCGQQDAVNDIDDKDIAAFVPAAATCVVTALERSG